MASTPAPATTADTQAFSNGPSVSFLATLGSEWSKFVTLRTMWISVILSVVLATAMTGLISWASAWSYDQWSDADMQSWDPVLFSASGAIVSAIVFVVMSVQLVASEYSTGMIRQTMTTTPKRSRVFWSKLIISVVVITILTAIGSITSFFVAQWIFGIYDAPTVGFGNSDVQRLFWGMVMTAPVYPVLATAAAFLLRSAAGAITLVIGVIFLPSMFGGLLPRRWQEDVLAFLPPSANDSVALHHLDANNPQYLDPPMAGLVLLVWGVVICAATLIVLNRRDV